MGGLDVLGKGIGGQRDDGDVVGIGLTAQTNHARCLVAVHIGHHDVHEDGVEAAGGMRQVQVDNLVAVGRAGYHDFLGFQQLLGNFGIQVVVFGEQDTHAGERTVGCRLDWLYVGLRVLVDFKRNLDIERAAHAEFA